MTNDVRSPTDVASELDEQGRPQPPAAADETATLVGFLEYVRATLAWKCSGLDAAALRTTLGPSSMTLGGMLAHLARVEDYWFSYALYAHEAAAPWNRVDWKAEPDWDWDSAAGQPPEVLFAAWKAAVQRSRDLLARAL